jgi:hypothetical protein
MSLFILFVVALATLLVAVFGAICCGDIRKPTNPAHAVLTFAVMLGLFWLHPALWGFAMALVFIGAVGNMAAA